MTDRGARKQLTLEQAIGQVLRKERLGRGLKQVDVTAATNFGVRTIRTMEYGRQSMTIRSLDALALFFDLPIEEVIVRAKCLRESISER
jgi:transcriptional regulator with XRE-family HTH domain